MNYNWKPSVASPGVFVTVRRIANGLVTDELHMQGGAITYAQRPLAHVSRDTAHLERECGRTSTVKKGGAKTSKYLRMLVAMPTERRFNQLAALIEYKSGRKDAVRQFGGNALAMARRLLARPRTELDVDRGRRLIGLFLRGKFTRKLQDAAETAFRRSFERQAGPGENPYPVSDVPNTRFRRSVLRAEKRRTWRRSLVLDFNPQDVADVAKRLMGLPVGLFNDLLERLLTHQKESREAALRRESEAARAERAFRLRRRQEEIAESARRSVLARQEITRRRKEAEMQPQAFDAAQEAERIARVHASVHGSYDPGGLRVRGTHRMPLEQQQALAEYVDTLVFGSGPIGDL